METNNSASKRPERVVTTGTAATARRTGKSRLASPSKAVRAAQRPKTKAEIHAWVNAYRPANVDPRAWNAVRGFVVECTRALIDEHDVTAEALPRYTRALTKLALYCRRTHQQLDRATVLDPYTVNQFASAVATVEAANAGTYQSHLRYVGERLAPSPAWERPKPVGRRSVPVPYSAAELALLRDQIAKNTPERRRGGEALMTLGLGAGLDGRWSAKVEREDVQEVHDGLSVAVEGRIVPVLSSYEKELRRLVGATPTGGLLVGGTARHKNAANEIAARLRLDPECPKLHAGRLRSTWIVSHLTMGTRLPELAEAAGTVGITTFSDLLEFVPPLPGDRDQAQRAATAMLRGVR